MSSPLSIPIICGPTASGKTGIAVALAERFQVEVVSADSRQIIRRLNIGTAKPTPEERNLVPFHLVDVVDPGERYSAFRFIEDAEAAITDMLGRGRIPLVVGGTGLYLRALAEGVVEIDGDDLAIRTELEQEMAEFGPDIMHARLEKIDPLEAARVHPNNKVRVLRALELFYQTGKCKSELTLPGASRQPKYRFTWFCMMPERAGLYATINERVDRMLAAGLLQEVQDLVNAGWGERLRSARVIGYTELLDHLDGRTSLGEAVAAIKQNTRRYAKRQSTWFRHQIAGAFHVTASETLSAVEKCLGERQ